MKSGKEKVPFFYASQLGSGEYPTGLLNLRTTSKSHVWYWKVGSRVIGIKSKKGSKMKFKLERFGIVNQDPMSKKVYNLAPLEWTISADGEEETWKLIQRKRKEKLKTNRLNLLREANIVNKTEMVNEDQKQPIIKEQTK
jgi:hypothetical protein